MHVHLIAIQAAMGPAHYESPEAFRAKVLGLAERAVEGLDEAPKLIAFPEAIGLPLLFADDARLLRLGTVREVMLYELRRRWRDILRLGLHFGLAPLPALYRLRAPGAFAAYRAAFAEAARATNATIVAGTIFIPDVDEEAALGLHVAGRRVYNTAYAFAPSGGIINRTRKVHLTPGAESRAGLSRGPAEDLSAFDTPAGRIGVAVCLDGFHRSTLDRLDGQGAQIVVQPSANHAAWDRPWPANPGLTEGEAWLRLGLRRQVQDRLHLQYGLNPMLVGDVWDLHARGRSSVVANGRFVQTETAGYPGVVALAKSADAEEVLRVRVPLAGRI